MPMKSGTGDDLWADDDEATEDIQENADEEPQSTGQQTQSTMTQTDTDPESQTSNIPYKYKRSTVKEGRTHVPIYLQDSTQKVERNVRNDVEDLVGEDVPLADLREAAYLYALENPEGIASVLQRWGYKVQE